MAANIKVESENSPNLIMTFLFVVILSGNVSTTFSSLPHDDTRRLCTAMRELTGANRLL